MLHWYWKELWKITKKERMVNKDRCNAVSRIFKYYLTEHENSWTLITVMHVEIEKEGEGKNTF